MNIRVYQITPFVMNCYVVEDGGDTIVIDPGEAHPRLLADLADRKVTMIVNTHGHIDHCGGNAGLIKATGAPLAIHRADLALLEGMREQGMMFGIPSIPSPAPDRFLDEGDTIQLGDTVLEVVHVPGHSPGHIALIGNGHVFAGDVLFRGSIGRTDLLGGDYDTLIASIHSKLLTLPDETVVHCGHGPDTTIGAERRMNPFLR